MKYAIQRSQKYVIKRACVFALEADVKKFQIYDWTNVIHPKIYYKASAYVWFVKNLIFSAFPVCRRIIKHSLLVEKQNKSYESRVTSYDILVTSSNPRVKSSNPWVASSNLRATSSNSGVTSSNPRVRRRKAQVSRLKVWVGRLKAQLGN